GGVTDVENEILRELPLNREVPVLDVRPADILLHVYGLGVHRAEVRRGCETIGNAELRGAEAGQRIGTGRAERLRRGLRDLRVHHERTVVRQITVPALPDEEDVAQSVAGANDRLRIDAVSEADARAPVVVARLDQRAVRKRAVLCVYQRIRGGV